MLRLDQLYEGLLKKLMFLDNEFNGNANINNVNK